MIDHTVVPNLNIEEARFAKTVAKRASVVYPALTGSKTPTSKFSGSKEVRWGATARKSPIGSTNNQWGMNKTPTD
ncbi:hypothetical protein bcgnr5378_51380 [Bacillus cereus]|nr:hypothetical protein BCER1_52750 [Bacillus cereus]